MLNTEYLSDDILEEEYLKSFAPYFNIQKILGSCRVDARDRFVTATTYYQKAYTVICIIISANLYVHLNYTLYNYQFINNYNLYVMCFWVLALIYLTFLCIIIHVRFVNCEENAKFFIQLQKIDRLMKIENNQQINTFLHILNNISVKFLPIMYLIPCITMWYQDLTSGFGIMGVFYSQTTTTVEIICCANITVFFFIRLRFLNSIMRNHLYGDIQHVKMNCTNYPSIKRICFLAAKSHDFVSSDTDLYLREILNAFHNFQLLFRYQILVFYGKLMSITYIIFNIVLLLLQDREVELFFYVHIPIIITTDILLSTCVCIGCQVFFNEINYTKRLCTNIMAMHYTGPLRDKAKRMWILIEKAPPKFSVYDMWHVDLFLLLKTFHITTTLIITRLQFALL